ncbi:MAG: cytochrome c-type biogenesis protein CcmH [Gammaproteobacteria bacterium]|nr:cytochrome c-type biogenesis protein CcmH [Gammaproteobacteria bacterium]
MRKFFLLMLTFYALAPYQVMAAEDLYTFQNQQAAQRFHLMTKQIRCVVCQNQSLDESNAPLAKDLREKIYQMILNNETNQTIETFLVSRYGEFILLQPPVNPTTLLLWSFPFIAFLIVGGIIRRLTR